jgi:hypothetical protein
MRPVLAAIIWIVLIGGLTWHVHTRENPKPIVSPEAREVEGHFSLTITATFPMEPDPFALRIGDRLPPSLVVKVNGQEVLRRTDSIAAGVPIRVEHVKGLVEGGNEFYLEANPPIALSSLPQAAQIQVLREGYPVIERAVWSEPGWKMATTLSLRIEAPRPQEKHPHG